MYVDSHTILIILKWPEDSPVSATASSFPLNYQGIRDKHIQEPTGVSSSKKSESHSNYISKFNCHFLIKKQVYYEIKVKKSLISNGVRYLIV